MSSHLSEHTHYTVFSYQGYQYKTVTETFNKDFRHITKYNKGEDKRNITQSTYVMISVFTLFT